MNKSLVAHATTDIHATSATVWDALVNPALIRQYMFGTEVTSDFKKGSRIVWKGEWKGRRYEDKGEILRLEPERLIQYSHFSPLSGLPDTPENYHTVTIELTPCPPGTRVALSQDNNASEQDREHSEQNWVMMLSGLKALLEGKR